MSAAPAPARSLRRVFVDAALVGGLAVVAKASVAGRDLLLARSFGASDAVDAFLVAFVVPLFAINVFSGALQSALIPALIRTRERDGASAANEFVRRATAWNFTLMLVVAVVLGVAGPGLLRIVASGFEGTKLALTSRLFVMFLPSLLLSGLDATWSAALNAHRRFVASTVAPISTSLAPAIVLLLAGSGWGIEAIALATTIGFAGQTIMLASALRLVGYSPWPHWARLTGELAVARRQYAPMVAGTFLLWGTTVVDQAMATRLAAGSVSVLSYGNRIVALISGIGVVSIGTAVFPHFSDLIAHRRWAEVSRACVRGVAVVVAVGAAASAVLIAFSEPLIRIVFQRGAFAPETTHAVALVQSCYALQIPFFAGSAILVRLISALQANRLLMWGAAISLVLDVVANYLFMRWLGVRGIALSTSLVYFVSFLFAVACTRMLLKRERARG